MRRCRDEAHAFAVFNHRRLRSREYLRRFSLPMLCMHGFLFVYQRGNPTTYLPAVRWPDDIPFLELTTDLPPSSVPSIQSREESRSRSAWLCCDDSRLQRV